MRIEKMRKRIALLKARRTIEDKAVLDKLNDYLETESNEPIKWLTQFWSDQQKAITYKELREAIMAGQISEKTLREWQIAYSNLVTRKMKPLWQDAMIAANTKSALRQQGFYFDPTAKNVRDWMETYGAEWVTLIEEGQKKAIAAMLERAYTTDWTVDELSRAIRPTIGLTEQQATANFNYYKHIRTSLLENNPGMGEATAASRAREAAAKYAARQHRERAYTIATTEMAFAYNKGADEAIKQTQERKYIGRVKRVWSTAADELVCPMCGALEGTEIEMDGEFEFEGRSLYGGQKQTPPAHPRCRCATKYIEVAPPIYEGEIALNYDEEYSLKSYISSESYIINEKLRNGTALTPAEYSMTTSLDSTLSKMPKYEGTLTRSLVFNNAESQADFLSKHKKGSVIEYDQYISTTKSGIYNPDGTVQILIIYSTNGRDVSRYNDYEKEVIYERGSIFRVLEVNELEDGTVAITMEEHWL